MISKQIGKRIIFQSRGNAVLEDFVVREPREKECVIDIKWNRKGIFISFK